MEGGGRQNLTHPSHHSYLIIGPATSQTPHPLSPSFVSGVSGKGSEGWLGRRTSPNNLCGALCGRRLAFVVSLPPSPFRHVSTPRNTGTAQDAISAAHATPLIDTTAGRTPPYVMGT